MCAKLPTSFEEIKLLLLPIYIYPIFIFLFFYFYYIFIFYKYIFLRQILTFFQPEIYRNLIHTFRIFVTKKRP
jgi:hypothetical protein